MGGVKEVIEERLQVIEERFSDQLIFVTAKVNNPEVVISNQVFQDTIHHSVNKSTTV